jgi:hypothetical protein
VTHFETNRGGWGVSTVWLMGEGFEERNNFPYWTFSKFGIKFELKIKNTLGFEFESNLMEF